MKTSAVKLLCAIVVGAMTLAAPATFAGTINKAATGTDLAAGASWTGGTAPGSGDVATWASGSLGGALTMSTGPTWGGIALTTATADPTIAAPGSGAFTLGSSGIDLSSTANNMTINAPITLGASQIWNVNVGKTLTAGGLMSGTAFGLTKNGAGTLVLSVSNSFGGGVTLNAGTNVLGNAFALGTGSVTLNGGTLKNNGAYNISNNIVVGASGGTITLNSANNISYFGNVTGAGNLTLGGSWGGSASSVQMYGTNLMTSGTVTMNPTPAVARLKTPDASSAVLDWVMNGGSTEVSGTFNFGSFNGSGNFNAFNNNSGTTIYNIGGNNHDAIYSAVLSANGTGQQLSIVKVGTGAQIFSGANSYSGTTTVENGSLIASNNVSTSAAGPFGNAATAIIVGDDVTINTNIAMHPQLLINGAFTMARPVTVGTASGALGNVGTTFTLGGNSISSATFSGSFLTMNQNLIVTQATGGSLTISAPISDGGNNLGLTKIGGGTVTLSGANSYAGTTIVSQGVLLIGNTSPANGVVTVADGAGVGVIATADSTYWSPSSLAVGTSTGGTLQFSLAGTITGPNANTLLTPTSLTLNGTTAISITRCPQVLGSYPLFNGYNGSSPLTLASQPAGVLGRITASSGTVYYQVTNTLTDVWTAQTSTNWDTGTVNWTNTLGGNTYGLGDPVRFDDTANGTGPLLVNIVSNVSPNSITVNNTSKAYVIGGAAIAGATGLTKNGNNTLTLTGTNTFTGDLAILGGTLEIGSGAGGQLGAGTYAGNIDDETLLRYNSTNAQTLSGIISGPGVVLATNGSLTLNGVNTYSGGTTFTNATVNFGNNSAFGTGTITANGGTLKNTSTTTDITTANSLVVNGSNTLDSVSKNWTVNANISGSGAITRGVSGTVSLFLNGDNSGYTGTFTVPANGNAVVRFNSANSGSANASWVINQNTSGRFTFNFGNGTISFGSLTGSGFVQQASAGTTVIEAGALGLNDIFSGVLQQSAGANVLTFTKVGTGRMTLSGANTFLGGVNINNGILCVSNTSALSTAGNITFGGGTLQYSGVSGVDYSPRIASSTAPISIDLQGTNVTFATALPSSNTGGLALTNSTGISTNKLTLTAAEAYTGSTIINGGALALSGSGNIGSSTNITVASGGTFDVSGVSFTLSGSQTLAGSGVVTGAVTTASSGSAILPGGAGIVGTLSFSNNVNLGSGASPVFDLSTSSSSGNDKIVVAGNLTANSSDTIHVNALSGSSPLDQSADYVLFSVAGTTTMASQPLLVFDNTPPSNASHYSIQKSGNNVVLRYSSNPAPVVTSVIITNTADGSTVGVRGQSATIYVTVQPGNGTLGAGSVTANLSLLGGSSSQVLNYLGGNSWSYTILLGQGAVVGTDSVGVTATDSLSASGSSAGSFTVNASSLTWNGSGGNANWGTGGNWDGSIPPGFGGDSVTFTGGVNTSPNLEANYSVAGITFDGAASSFTNGSTTGKALTLAGPVNNYSGNPQVFTLAVTNSGSPVIADSGAGITFAGPIFGGGLEVSSGTVTLAGGNTYTANTIIDGGAMLKVGGSAALPYGGTAGNVSISGTLDVNGTNAAINGLSGSGIVDNTSTNPAVLNIGNANVNSTFAGVIQNTGTNLALVKTGTGTLILSGANTYSGGLTLSNGAVVVENNSAFGSGVVTLAGGTNQNLIGNVTVTNTFFAVTNTTTTIDVVGGNYTFNGNFAGSGTIARSIGASPPASLFLGGDNSGFTGTFQDGNSANSVVRFTANTAGSASARWIFNQAQLLGRTTLPTVTGTIQFGSISGGGFLSPNAGGIVDTVEVGALGLNDTFSGVLSDNSGGILALTKVGNGTLTLSGANNYTGPTIVSNGTLNVSSRKVSSGDFTLIGGTTLGVNLITNGASLQMTSLTFGNNCTNTFTGTNSTTVPAINNSGALTLSGRVVVNAQGGIFATVGQYPLISYGSITGTGGFALGSLPTGVTANIITNGTAIVLNVTQVPVLGPVTITNSFSGNTLTLTWPAGQGWRLVSQTNSLSTGLNPNPSAWNTVPGYTDGSYSVTADPAKPTVFYRLVNP
ncbi:MAG TPA: autotransporter-associated beta strand repeat-containing protein [bacterium]|nr:autotransporter-associated beta strand repeat-containing protein [bacterium]